jgi:hypothetical protein
MNKSLLVKFASNFSSKTKYVVIVSEFPSTFGSRMIPQIIFLKISLSASVSSIEHRSFIKVDLEYMHPLRGLKQKALIKHPPKKNGEVNSFS